MSLFHSLKEFYVQKWLMADAEKSSITDMEKVGALEAKEANIQTGRRQELQIQRK